MTKLEAVHRIENADTISLCSDAKLRGIEEAGFKVICDCGRERKFVFTKRTWDIFPCPYCKASGVKNKAK